MRITWKGGVSIQHKDVEIVIDPQNGNLVRSSVFVTHGHFDHLRAFEIDHVRKHSSKETMDIVSAYGFQVENGKALTVNEKVALDDIEVIPHNSGHVLGSYEFEIATPGGTILYTGDFNTEHTKTMKPAQPVSCDVLILESTFGSPSFVFPSGDAVAGEMIGWAKKIMKTGKIPAFQTDPLGNAQEIVSIFNEASIPVVTHWKVSRINHVYEAYGHKLEYIDARSNEAEEVVSSGDLAFIAPKRFDFQDHPEFVPALASGWAVWSKSTAFALSDHADFPRLLRFVEECAPKVVLTCHGGRFTETLAGHIERELGIRAYPAQFIPTNLAPKPDHAKTRYQQTILEEK